MPTLRTSADMIDMDEKAYISLETIISMQTFPADYMFENMNRSHVAYVCGMSVPPIMMKRVVQKLIEQKVFSYDLGRDKRKGNCHLVIGDREGCNSRDEISLRGGMT